MIVHEFMGYIREKYPEITTINREEDMGIDGLRRSKLSYYPLALNLKYDARLKEA